MGGWVGGWVGGYGWVSVCVCGGWEDDQPTHIRPEWHPPAHRPHPPGPPNGFGPGPAGPPSHAIPPVAAASRTPPRAPHGLALRAAARLGRHAHERPPGDNLQVDETAIGVWGGHFRKPGARSRTARARARAVCERVARVRVRESARSAAASPQPPALLRPARPPARRRAGAAALRAAGSVRRAFGVCACVRARALACLCTCVRACVCVYACA